MVITEATKIKNQITSAQLQGLRDLLPTRLKPKAPLIQLVGPVGSGAYRLAFDFLKPAHHILWLSPEWKIYAPLLWQIARTQNTELVGLECSDRKKLRRLLKEVVQSQAFEGIVLDHFKLNSAEGFFLQHLLTPFATSIKILILDTFPQAFCSERVHISLSHTSIRYAWSKGGDPTPRYIPFKYLQEIESRPECMS